MKARPQNLMKQKAMRLDQCRGAMCKHNESVEAICTHIKVLGHEGLGVTELRIFDPVPMVAYVDNEDDFIHLCLEMDGKSAGVFVGVQPRPLWLFDLAPNQWIPARSGPGRNCGNDNSIEYLGTLYFDIDVISMKRAKGHPASNEELVQTLRAAQLLYREKGLALCSTICCSGNGHYVLASFVPIPVDNEEIPLKFRSFCRQLVDKVTGQVSGVKFDSVYNPSRVMRVMGTLNQKGQSLPGRPHRRAHFVTDPVTETRSMVLHHMILNTEIDQNRLSGYDRALPQAIKCNLDKIEKCCFIQYCRRYPELISEPQWWGLITNLARLEGGSTLIHEISRLDPIRYDYPNTERIIKRVLTSEYRPVSCETLMSYDSSGCGRGNFICSKIRQCPARALMYMTSMYSVYTD